MEFSAANHDRTPLSGQDRSGAASTDKRWSRDLLTVAWATLLFFFLFLGVRPLSNPDEGRYTEIPREMAASNDYVTPRLNGVKYFEKPPLLYWLTAAAIEVGGVNEWTSRFWCAVFAAGGCLLSYCAGRALFGRAAGCWSAVVLATSLFYYLLSRVLLLDLAVAVLMAAALFAFLGAVRCRKTGRMARVASSD